MKEIAKRLSLTRETLRELYLKSGNQCAFPLCSRLMIDTDGNFVGQICHIEAAEPGGPRFNAKQTNDDRRAVGNLMLLCYDHHVATNDVAVYTVQRLKQMKAKHESKFTDIIGKIQEKTMDLSKVGELKGPRSCRRLNDVLGWALGPEELKETAQDVVQIAKKVKTLPPSTREVLAIIIERSYIGTFKHLEAGLTEIEKVTGRSTRELKPHVAILIRTGLISEVDEDDMGLPTVQIYNCPDGWDFWSDLKLFCEKTGVSMAQVLHDTDFTFLD